MLVHARILLLINLLKTSLLLHGSDGTEKLCTRFSEDGSINDVTILSTDATCWTDTGHVKEINTLSIVQCYAPHWTVNKRDTWPQRQHFIRIYAVN